MNYSHQKSPIVLETHKSYIESVIQILEKMKAYRHELVNQDPQLKERIDKVSTIKGVGFDTIVSIICETNGFRLFNNMRQVVSYAGLDVSHNQSGTIKGKSSISKKGNARIRQVLYMPALSAIQYNKPIKALYERVKENNPTVKQKGVVAAMRKLLLLVYVLWTKNEEYNANYQWGTNV